MFPSTFSPAQRRTFRISAGYDESVQNGDSLAAIASHHVKTIVQAIDEAWQVVSRSLPESA